MPTAEVFAKLPAGTVENLLKPENKDQLRAVLTHHVVSRKVIAADVVKLKSAATLNGQKAKFEVKDGTAYVDNAQVVKTDIDAAIGISQVIDAMILPKSNKASD